MVIMILWGWNFFETFVPTLFICSSCENLDDEFLEYFQISRHLKIIIKERRRFRDFCGSSIITWS